MPEKSRILKSAHEKHGYQHFRLGKITNGKSDSFKQTVEKLYDKIKQDNEKLNNYMNSFNKQNEDILEKQKQIEDLLDEVFTDELKITGRISKLAEEFDTKKFNELTEKMDLTYEDLQKQLDRNIEMLRKMKVEQKLQDAIDNLNKMASEETKMADEISEQRKF